MSLKRRFQMFFKNSCRFVFDPWQRLRSLSLKDVEWKATGLFWFNCAEIAISHSSDFTKETSPFITPSNISASSVVNLWKVDKTFWWKSGYFDQRFNFIRATWYSLGIVREKVSNFLLFFRFHLLSLGNFQKRAQKSSTTKMNWILRIHKMSQAIKMFWEIN